MNKKQFVIDLIDAKIAQDFHEDRLRGAIDILAGGASDFDPVVFDLYKFHRDLIELLIGEENAEWIDWYLYDNYYSTEQRGGSVEIHGHSHDIETVEQLYDICMDHSAFNESLFEC